MRPEGALAESGAGRPASIAATYLSGGTSIYLPTDGVGELCRQLSIAAGGPQFGQGQREGGGVSTLLRTANAFVTCPHGHMRDMGIVTSTVPASPY